MLTLDQARALIWEADVGTEEILFSTGLPLTLPSSRVAPLPPLPPPPAPKKTLGDIRIPTAVHLGEGEKAVEEMKKAATPSDLFAAMRRHPFYKTGSLLSGAGPVPARLILVAGRFQPDDFSSSLPFLGETGRLLDDLFRTVQLRRNLCWQTALFKGDWKRNFLPREKQLMRDLFALEVGMIGPKVIVTLGEPAAELLFGRKTDLESPASENFSGVPVCLLSHPLQWSGNPSLRHRAEEKLNTLREHLRSADPSRETPC